MGKVKTERFPPNAEHGKCSFCGRLVVLSEKPVLTVWHEDPECHDFAAMIADLKPTTNRVGVVLTPEKWMTK